MNYHTHTKQSGTSLTLISETLTYRRDTNITETNVNTPNVIKMPVGEIAYRKLTGGNNKKNASQIEL